MERESKEGGNFWEGAGEGGGGEEAQWKFLGGEGTGKVVWKGRKGKCPEVERERLQGKEGKGKCSEVERERKERGNVLKWRGKGRKGEMF